MKIQKILIYLFVLSCVGVAFALPQLDKGKKAGSGMETVEPGSMPTLLEFTSASCAICAKMRPVMEQLQKEFEGKIEFVEYSVDEPEGAKLSVEYKVDGLPSFFIFDKSHKVVQHFESEVPLEMMRQLLAQVSGG
jgi:thiol-disulfide isomerase/thioredoxin